MIQDGAVEYGGERNGRTCVELVSKMLFRGKTVRARLQPCRKRPEQQGLQPLRDVFAFPDGVLPPIFETSSSDEDGVRLEKDYTDGAGRKGGNDRDGACSPIAGEMEKSRTVGSRCAGRQRVVGTAQDSADGATRRETGANASKTREEPNPWVLPGPFQPRVG